jgi:hypothetical protein
MGILGPETGDKMRRKDERTVDMGKTRDQTWFSHLKCSSREFHPQFGFCNGCSSSSLNMKDLSEVDPCKSFMKQYPFFSLCACTEIGDETGFRGSNYGLKTR